MWITVSVLMLIHLGCFIIIIVFISQQQTFINDASAAGEIIDVMHQARGEENRKKKNRKRRKDCAQRMQSRGPCLFACLFACVVFAWCFAVLWGRVGALFRAISQITFLTRYNTIV